MLGSGLTRSMQPFLGFLPVGWGSWLPILGSQFLLCFLDFPLGQDLNPLDLWVLLVVYLWYVGSYPIKLGEGSSTSVLET